MSSTTIRITESDKKTLTELKERFGEPIQSLLHEAIEQYRRHRLLADSNAAYARLREDPAAWREVEEESAPWDATLADGAS